MHGKVTRAVAPVAPVALSDKARDTRTRGKAVEIRRTALATLPAPATERFSVDWEMPASIAVER